MKAKSTQKIGNKIFYKNEPVLYFDTLKTSTMEGASTTVYAQGGRGNSRLIAWEGERTITFTMEDALISPEGFAILSGAGLIDASKSKTLKVHVTETIDAAGVDDNDLPLVSVSSDGTSAVIKLSNKPYLPSTSSDNYAYVMFMKDGEIVSEPFIPVHEDVTVSGGYYPITVASKTRTFGDGSSYDYAATDIPATGTFDSVLVDYYTEKQENAQQIEITADKFGGNYYLEASTLFRDQHGVDLPAEFIIPNCDIQSNFTFTMSSSGDPSTFTFTMDAFPDYTRFDHSKKVLAAIQIMQTGESLDLNRSATAHEASHEKLIEY